MSNALVGASVWEDALYEHLTTHEDSERELLQEYRQAAEEAGSPALSYLTSLILEDEIRHHRLFRELAESLRTDVEFRNTEPAVPRINDWRKAGPRLTEVVEHLLEREKADQRSLHQLEKELRDVRDTTLWGLLVKLMQADTAKHIEILDFVRRHAGRND